MIVIATAVPSQITTRAVLEARLLDLFAPAKPDRRVFGDRRIETSPSLWRLDAIHRAKNLAQLSTSLANLVSRPSDFWPAAESAAPARALARSYDILGRDCASSVPVPCIEMMTEVAVRLGLIFGQSRNIAVEVHGDEIYVTPERRRSLVLICSELVINALKYAFPVDGPGAITVTLRRRPSGIRLIVEDNGIGFRATDTPGEGGGLIDRLAHVSGATLTRRVGGGGTGARVEIRVPAPCEIDGSMTNAA